MPIQPASPIVIPEKQLTKLWAKRIVILAPVPDGEAMAEVALLPYNDEGVTAEEATQTLNISDIMAKATANPASNIAKAMFFLLAAIDDEYREANGP